MIIIKILIYTGMLETVKKSGVGKAIEHQMTALTRSNIPFTTNKKDDFDLVHINTIFPDSFFMSLFSRMRGKTVVYHAHSTMEDFKNSFRGSNFFAPLFKLWITLCYNRAHLLLTPTPYSKSLLEAYGIKKTIIPISNGIDIYFYKDAQSKRAEYRAKYGIKDTDRLIISVGHYMERKGIIDFMETAKALPEYKFMWCGYTPDAALTAGVRAAIKSAPPNVILAGFVPSGELKYLYGASDLFLFMSHEETEGIVVLEALASKIPVLLRDIHVYDSWLTDNINVYKAADEEGFIRRIKGIFSGELPSLSEAGYEVCEERSMEKTGRNLYAAYEKAEKLRLERAGK